MNSQVHKLTPLLHKDASESNGCPHKKTVSNLFGILSKGHSWIDPGDDIDFTAGPSLVKVLMNSGAEFNATTGLINQPIAFQNTVYPFGNNLVT
jgi:hypothetical protein